MRRPPWETGCACEVGRAPDCPIHPRARPPRRARTARFDLKLGSSAVSQIHPAAGVVAMPGEADAALPAPSLANLFTVRVGLGLGDCARLVASAFMDGAPNLSANCCRSTTGWCGDRLSRFVFGERDVRRYARWFEYPDMNAQIAAALGECSSPGRFGPQFLEN